MAGLGERTWGGDGSDEDLSLTIYGPWIGTMQI